MEMEMKDLYRAFLDLKMESNLKNVVLKELEVEKAKQAINSMKHYKMDVIKCCTIKNLEKEHQPRFPILHELEVEQPKQENIASNEVNVRQQHLTILSQNNSPTSTKFMFNTSTTIS